ncbi:MAG TPA: hypothetical protein VI461_17140 [Chitinophagaceae bacterium]|nr:hypothetical protein [Chitinophagaceae bacterium]
MWVRCCCHAELVEAWNQRHYCPEFIEGWSSVATLRLFFCSLLSYASQLSLKTEQSGGVAHFNAQ